MAREITEIEAKIAHALLTLRRAKYWPVAGSEIGQPFEPSVIVAHLSTLIDGGNVEPEPLEQMIFLRDYITANLEWLTPINAEMDAKMAGWYARWKAEIVATKGKK